MFQVYISCFFVFLLFFAVLRHVFYVSVPLLQSRICRFICTVSLTGH